ncbi:ATP-binding protein [Candidatus Peregrinibacteria bacterium]|nr:ATP-binding protein [Candidatus Peregrinibacteria bacterium]
MLERAILPEIEKRLFKGKIIIIYGPRRVGKTTLAKEILRNHDSQDGYFNCEEPDINRALTNKTSTELKKMIGERKLVVLDEAQKVKNIGLTLKLLVDNFPEIQVIATGSSSFDLANETAEPLTGRTFEFKLFPFSLNELKQKYSQLEIDRLLETFLRFGTYPEAVQADSGFAAELISDITRNYLYKDILEFERLKNPDLILKLLQALALQLGSEVAYTELANLLGVDKITVERYIQILEKAFVIFRLTPLSRNLRRELTKTRKIYFCDLGIRNSLINNFNELNLRTDIGAIWENFCILERLKFNSAEKRLPNIYFWRTYDQKEIDYLEEEGGIFRAFEFKWEKGKYKFPVEFGENYPRSEFKLIYRDNFWELFA